MRGGIPPLEINMEEIMSKIVIGMYTGEYTNRDFTPNVLSIQAALFDFNMYGGFIHRSSCRVDSNRNYLIEYFLHDTYVDFLFIID